jgi:TPR repeat protein
MSEQSIDVNALTPRDIAAAMAGSPADVAAWMRNLAEQGVVEAQAIMGQICLDGRGIEADPAAGLTWFQKAAEAGHPMALNMVGRCHENGWGVAPDTAVAAAWYLRSANAGSPWGMYNYASRLAQGDGVAEDRAAAYTWFKTASDLGHDKSMNLLGGFHEDGWETPKDMAAARALYRASAAGGDFRGQFNYARFLSQEGHIKAAVDLFRLAFAGGTPAFRQKMTGFLTASPLTALRELATTLDGA